MESKTKLATFAVAYGLCIATCYLWTYWGAFGINVFEYASFSDVATRAILPVAAAFVPLAVGSGIAEISPLRQVFPAGGGRDTRVGVFVNNHTRLLSGLSIIVGGAVLGLSNSPLRWLLATPFFLPLVMALESHPLMADLLPDGKVRSVLIPLGILALFAAAASGALSAEQILRGKSDRVVDESTVRVPLKATEAHPVEYIGYVGGTYFLYETQTRSVVILKQTDHDAIVLKPKIVSDAQTSD
ncbi:hypothetical protein [Burkholderia sp. USMB20]|uniref:hypothetical protein n=1 Tax=Burkholderia sp. USMB20 TaxID=1571773 RepID=UPI0005CF4A10|nr:hypothetical protein [Burkholderia sp. USMB20]TGN96137.1 hypothetical protein PL79_019030 [Burkholderia sp. USMB20]